MPEALLQMHPLAVWIAQIIEPRSFVITGRVHHKRVSLPVTNRPAVPARVRVLRDLTPIRPDFPGSMSPFEYLHDLVGSLYHLERPAIGPKVSWVSQGIAVS